MVKKKTKKRVVKKSTKKTATKKTKRNVQKPTKKTVKKKTVKKKTAIKPKKTTKKKTTKKIVKRAPKKSAASVKRKTSSRKTARVSLRRKMILKIKEGLLAQRNALLKEAEEALNILPGEINFPDMGDQATAETDRNFMLRLRDRERMLLKKIDEAVERIDTNSFGVCNSCGSDIGIKRLQARPVTDLCIECKTRQEEDERITEG